MERNIPVANMTVSWTQVLVRTMPTLANSLLSSDGLWLVWSGLKVL